MEDPNAPRPNEMPGVPSRPLRPTDAAELSHPAAGTLREDVMLSDVERRRKTEQDLVRLGMSAGEIRRLLDASADTADPGRPSPSGMASDMTGLPSIPLPGGKGKALSPNSMTAYAADLMQKRTAELQQRVAQAEAQFPPFREADTQDLRQAEALLRDAAMLRRREKFKDAEAKCREALNLTPKDSAALELLGDVLQGVARVEEALAAYKRAVEADPKRASAEVKYGDLLMRQQQWGGPDPEEVEKNPWHALLFSLLLPGIGQIFNREIVKGVLFLLADAVCFYLLLAAPFGFGLFLSSGKTHHLKWADLDAARISMLVFSLAVYVAGAVDAYLGAGRGSRRGTGWEV